MGNKFKLLAIVIGILLIALCVISCAPHFWGSPSGCFPFGWSPFIGLPFGLIGIGLYFLPTIFAVVRRKRNILGIVLLNVFAGWTFIGWIIALVWSLTGNNQEK